MSPAMALPRQFHRLAYFIGAAGRFHNETRSLPYGFMVASCAQMF
jgi:hypothetical protein